MRGPSPVTGRKVRLPFRQLVGMATERFLVLAYPGSEVSPVRDGATCLEWARLAGLTGDVPNPLLHARWTLPLSCGDHDPENVAHIALQRLTQRSLTERRGGLPFTYRPVSHRRV